jgi:hypothetical protein
MFTRASRRRDAQATRAVGCLQSPNATVLALKWRIGARLLGAAAPVWRVGYSAHTSVPCRASMNPRAPHCPLPALVVGSAWKAAVARIYRVLSVTAPSSARSALTGWADTEPNPGQRESLGMLSAKEEIG